MPTPAWLQSPMMKAARREPAARTPIWLMRQAGRFLPEYRRLRQKTLLPRIVQESRPLRRGCHFHGRAAGRRRGNPLLRPAADTRADGDAAGVLRPARGRRWTIPSARPPMLTGCWSWSLSSRLSYVIEAVRQTRAGSAESLPLIGFAGAPFTLAAYAIEGGGSRDYRRAKALMYTDTGAWDALMGRLSRAVTLYLNAQIEAGVADSATLRQLGRLPGQWTTIAATCCRTAAR